MNGKEGPEGKMKNIQKTLYSLSSLDELSVTEFSTLIKYLIQHEVRPGGPYNFTNSLKENVELNLIIFLLFYQLHKPLNNVLLYLKEHYKLLTKNQISSIEKLTTPKIPKQHERSLEIFYKNIREELVDELPKEILLEGMEIFKKIIAVDKKGEITEISKLFLKSINVKTNKSLHVLGIGNFYTWMAYSLYDDVLDKDTSNKVLPMANIFHRKAYQSYLDAGISSQLIQRIFNVVDEANTKELIYCRFKVNNEEIEIKKLPTLRFIKDLSGKKSLAHCLGPIYFSSLHNQSKEMENIFKCYCSARQLNDDIHDWESDLANGQITYVSALLLNKAGIKPGVYKIKNLIDKLRKIYWETELEKIIIEIKKLTEQTKKDFYNKLGVSKNSPFINKTLEPITESLQKAHKEIVKSKEFLAKNNF